MLTAMFLAMNTNKYVRWIDGCLDKCKEGLKAVLRIADSNELIKKNLSLLWDLFNSSVWLIISLSRIAQTFIIQIYSKGTK